jgi:DNA-binding LytR/AlgR family response regulator
VALYFATQAYVNPAFRDRPKCERSYLVRDTIAAATRRLDERLFVRIHSALVNFRRDAEIRDDTVVVLRDGTELTMSRRFRARVRAVVR